MIYGRDARLSYGGGAAAGDMLASRLLVRNQRLQEGCDLVTSCLISLFTHRRTGENDQLPDDDYSPVAVRRSAASRRGWWMDYYRPRPMGSLLWLLRREKQTEEVRRRAESYANEALEWLVADRIAERVEVEASYPRRYWLRIDITIWRGRARETLRIDWPWSQLGVECVNGSLDGGTAGLSITATTMDSTVVTWDSTRTTLDAA